MNFAFHSFLDASAASIPPNKSFGDHCNQLFATLCNSPWSVSGSDHSFLQPPSCCHYSPHSFLQVIVEHLGCNHVSCGGGISVPCQQVPFIADLLQTVSFLARFSVSGMSCRILFLSAIVVYCLDGPLVLRNLSSLINLILKFSPTAIVEFDLLKFFVFGAVERVLQ